MIEIKIDTEYIELGQLLRYCAIAENDGQAKMFIEDGIAKVNGETIFEVEKKIRKNDKVEIEGCYIFLVV